MFCFGVDKSIKMLVNKFYIYKIYLRMLYFFFWFKLNLFMWRFVMKLLFVLKKKKRINLKNSYKYNLIVYFCVWVLWNRVFFIFVYLYILVLIIIFLWIMMKLDNK